MDGRLAALLKNPATARVPETLSGVAAMLSRSPLLTSWRRDALISLAATVVVKDMAPGTIIYRFTSLLLLPFSLTAD